MLFAQRLFVDVEAEQLVFVLTMVDWPASIAALPGMLIDSMRRDDSLSQLRPVLCDLSLGGYATVTNGILNLTAYEGRFPRETMQLLNKADSQIRSLLGVEGIVCE